jgi:uncharacterized protein (TIGR02145 family)
MKANRKIGTWKAIAFLTAVIFLSSCTTEDYQIRPRVSTGQAEYIGDYSAVLVASVIPNGEATVTFCYQADNSAWITNTLSSTVTGNQAIELSLDLYELLSGTDYKFMVRAENLKGTGYGDTVSFTTTGISPVLKSVIVLNQATNITKTSAKISATVVPIQEESEISVEYQVENSTWTSKTLPTKFSGYDSVEVSFDLLNLELNTNYNFRIVVSNIAGEAISNINSFQTYAVSDYDGNLYHAVVIGTQTWLKENFKGTHYANGDPIPNVTDAVEWTNLNSGAYCYYNNDLEIGEIYGGMYNFWVGIDPRGLIDGWHVPAFEEFNILNKFVNSVDTGSAGLKMCDSTDLYWAEDDTWKVRTNSSGFTALPNGNRHIVSNYNFSELGNDANFWGSSEHFGCGNHASIGSGIGYLFLNSGYIPMQYGLGIRLLK